jgi:hypothetical protein
VSRLRKATAANPAGGTRRATRRALFCGWWSETVSVTIGKPNSPAAPRLVLVCRSHHSRLATSFEFVLVARMSHGVAVDRCKSLESNGNACNILRHRKSVWRAAKSLILLVPGEGIEPQTNGLQIRVLASGQVIVLTRSSRAARTCPNISAVSCCLQRYLAALCGTP